ncbi:hypothetical protein LguiB_031255 [Lonicera macranthoides]
MIDSAISMFSSIMEAESMWRGGFRIGEELYELDGDEGAVELKKIFLITLIYIYIYIYVWICKFLYVYMS